MKMITYDRLWQTMKQRGVSQYDLYTHYNVNRSQLNRLRHNENVEINTIDKLCNILQCRLKTLWSTFQTITSSDAALTTRKALLPPAEALFVISAPRL